MYGSNDSLCVKPINNAAKIFEILNGKLKKLLDYLNYHIAYANFIDTNTGTDSYGVLLLPYFYAFNFLIVVTTSIYLNLFFNKNCSIGLVVTTLLQETSQI